MAWVVEAPTGVSSRRRRLFLISLTAGGTGLNSVAADEGNEARLALVRSALMSEPASVKYARHGFAIVGPRVSGVQRTCAAIVCNR